MKITANNIHWGNASPEHIIYCILRANRVDHKRAEDIFKAAKGNGISLEFEYETIVRPRSLYNLVQNNNGIEVITETSSKTRTMGVHPQAP